VMRRSTHIAAWMLAGVLPRAAAVGQDILGPMGPVKPDASLSPVAIGGMALVGCALLLVVRKRAFRRRGAGPAARRIEPPQAYEKIVDLAAFLAQNQPTQRTILPEAQLKACCEVAKGHL